LPASRREKSGDTGTARGYRELGDIRGVTTWTNVPGWLGERVTVTDGGEGETTSAAGMKTRTELLQEGQWIDRG